jgi:hypothetical protein
MLELNASAFLGAATALARTHQIFSGLQAAYAEPLIPESITAIIPGVRNFSEEAQKVGAKLAVTSANRMLEKLSAEPCVLTVGMAAAALNDIESRFADHLLDVKMFALPQQEAIFMEAADSLVDQEGFSLRFPRTSFEVEEAAKCMALGRYTAVVFHAMRMLELGIKALGKRLSIPDPTKAAEKNWGKILGEIKARIDELWPVSSRLPDTEGAEFDALYATLDAVRNPWRNATMHVETIYAPHEAMHILRCSAFFMRKLSTICDEQGGSSVEPSLPGIEES